jgi:hypothetical protein
MSAKFYEITDRLDQLKKSERIDPNELSELAKYLQEEKYARYFFTDLNNPAWILPLHENGFFSNIPAPIEDINNRGYFSMPHWHAGEYLKRMASRFPHIIKQVALSLETDNSSAIRTMLEALRNIPVDITAETVQQFRKWVETPFANFMTLSDELGTTAEYLANGGQVESALLVLDILLEPIPIKDRFDETKLVASSRHDYYWLNEALQKVLQVLDEAYAIGVIDIAERQLIRAIELEHDPRVENTTKKTRSYWRLSINPRSDVNYENDIKNLLVNTIIFALDKACKEKDETAPKVITRYIDSEYSIFRRVGLYILRAWGQQYPDLLERAYTRYRKEPIIGGQFEFDKLLEIRFNDVPDFAKREILDERKNPDPQRVEDLLKQYPDRFEGETEEEKRQTLIERWQLQDLTPVASYLEGEDKVLYETLLEKYGQPAPSAEEGPAIVSWAGSESPLGPDDLSKKSVVDVVQFLLDFVPSSEAPFGEPSTEGLSRVFETDVQARASDYADNATLFINEDLRFVYHTHFLRGLENAVKNQEKFALRHVIALCEYIVNKEEDKFDRNKYEEGLPAAKLTVVQLFEELFRIRDPYIEDDLLEKSGQIIVELLYQEEPFPDAEEAQGYDPATHSLNCVHGVAMHSLVSYGLYCERKRKKEMGDLGTPAMNSLMKKTLTEKLDKTKNPSLAVHSVFGWYYPQFIYLDKEWALNNQEKIFPIEAEVMKYWRAAWSAYIRFSDVYTNVFSELIKQYQRALEEISTLQERQGLDRSNEKMATHILKAYLLDMVKLDSEDGLIPLYYRKADDETRSHGNLWLSQVLDTQRPSAKDMIWQKIWSLWQWRIAEAASSDNRSNYTKEIPSFSRLLKNAPLDLSELHPVIEQTLEFKIHGFEAHEIIKYLGNNAENYPDLAVVILNQILLSNQELYFLDDGKEAVEKILAVAIGGTDSNSKEKAIELINLFGERGDYSWRPLLNRLSE